MGRVGRRVAPSPSPTRPRGPASAPRRPQPSHLRPSRSRRARPIQRRPRPAGAGGSPSSSGFGFCSRCANADALSSSMSLFERGLLDAVAGSWPGCGRAKWLSQKRPSQRSVPSSPNRAYRMPRCSRYSTAARIWGQRPTSFSRRFQAALEHRWRGPRRRAGPRCCEPWCSHRGQGPLSQGDCGKLAHAETSCLESWRGGPATNVADVARGQPAPPA